VVHDLRGGRAQQPIDRAVAVRADHDQIRVHLLGDVAHHLPWRADRHAHAASRFRGHGGDELLEARARVLLEQRPDRVGRERERLRRHLHRQADRAHEH
jgi:hypothetical protein